MIRLIGAVMLVAGGLQPVTAQDRPRLQPDQYLCLLQGSCVEPTGAPVENGRVMLAPIPAPPPPPPPPPPGEGMRGPAIAISAFALATLGPPVDLRIAFPSGSSSLTSAARAELRSLASAMTDPAMTGRRFRIEGHTDSVGSAALNRRLSGQRANAVAAYLAQRGVRRTRLDSRGFGYDRPLVGRRAADPANRRVEAILIR